MTSAKAPSTDSLTVDQALQQAITLHQAGNLQEAERLYRAILEAMPKHPDANLNLGVLAVQVGQAAVALPHFKAALEANPNQGQYWLSYIHALIHAGQDDAARQVLEQGRQLGLQGEAVENLAGQLLPALSPVSRAKRGNSRSRNSTGHKSSGKTSQQANQEAQGIKALIALFNDGRFAEAENLARGITLRSPENGFAWKGLGAALKSQRRTEESLKPMLKAAALLPGDAEAHYNLGIVLQESGRLDEAEASYCRALAIKPDYVEVHNNLGNTFKELGRLDEACNSYRRALEIKADYAEAYSNLLFTLNYSASHHLSDHIEEARRFGQMVAGKAGQSYSAWDCPPQPDRLRVGVVSGDLRNHPVGYFIEGILAQLDPSRFELIAYPTDSKADELTARIKPHFSAWKPLDGLSDEAAARLIHADGVHLLLDLSGHTAKNRLPIFAWKPAPVQASWLGYFATTGVAEMDYLLGDPYVTPDEEAGHFTETIWRLPESYLCFTPPDVALDVRPLPAHTSGHITFGCFNNLTKMNDAVVILWAKVLQAVPDSCLLLKTKQLNDPGVCAATRQRFAACGVDPDRLLLEGRAPRLELLEAYNRVDIALDPFPYPGGTTSVEGLWMGVPVITRRGDHFLSHIGESIALNAGLADWIAENDADYVAKAVLHTSDLEHLATLRTTLRRQVLASPLFDAPRFARHLEEALWGMWERWENRQCPGTQEITTLVTMFNEGRYSEAEHLARQITVRFPRHGFGWKCLGAVLHSQGRTVEALDPMQKAAELLPGDAQAHFNLGFALNRLDRPRESEASYRRALEIEPDYAEVHNNLGTIFQNLGRLDEAEASFRRALAIQPDFAVAHNNLGNTLMVLGRLDEAKASCVCALEIKPDYAEAHSNLGSTLLHLGQLDEAEASYRRALDIKPDFAEASYNLGNTLRDQGRLPDAEASFRRALEIKPDYAKAHNNLGITLKTLGRLTEAEASLRQALAIQPDFVEAHNNLGNTLMDLGRLDEAEASFRGALAIKPDFAMAHNNLGNTLKDQGRLEEAEASYCRALAIKPDFAESYSNLGNILKDQGRLDEAEVSYRRALEIKADYAEAYSNLLFTLNYSASHHLSNHFEESLRFGQMVAGKAGQSYSAWDCPPRPDRLRVGVVSGDLRNHPVGYFLEGVLTRIDSSRLELIAYPTDLKADELTARIKPNFSAWKPLAGLSDEAAARLIHADGVHLLLDLSGHTAKNRLPIFAWKPAPVQASWLGYFATTGVAEMDYLLGDPYITPDEEAGHFTETIWRLPESYICLTPPDVSLEVGPLPAISAGHITFGCFNNLTKMNDAVVTIWAKVLLAVPYSRLLLKTKQLNDPGVCAATRKRFAACGITSDRLLLEGSAPRAELLGAYNRVDIALDPFPYPGGTTSVEGLWMGVPVITRRGDSFLSHIGESIAHNVGLADWIAANDDDYVAKAALHASDPARLTALRTTLRRQVLASPLFDAPRFARHLEEALWGMWERREHPDPQEMNSLIALFNEGRFSEAEHLARKMTDRFPDQGFGWKILGAVNKLQGATMESLVPMQKAAKLLPMDVDVHSNLGVALHDLGRLEEAEASYRRALEINPLVAEVHSNLGNTLRELGRLEEAEASCRRALEIKSDYAEALNNLGNTLMDLGHLKEAEASYLRALEIKPHVAEVHSNLGNTLWELGCLEEAEASCRRALEIKPDYAEAHGNLGVALQDLGRLEEAEASYHKALKIKPDALQYGIHAHLLLPAILESQNAITAWREHYATGIATLKNMPGTLKDPGKDCNPFLFYLAYHNDNDRTAMTGLNQLFRAKIPKLTAKAPHIQHWSSPVASGRRIRVGFLSEYLVAHTIGKLYQGYICHLDRSRFEVVIIHTPKAKLDSFSRWLNNFAEKSLVLPLCLEAQQAAIAAQKLDVLFYPDIGMAPSSYYLAYARLAPVQAVSWGHPDTTGLDTIDYFVSASAIEPEDAEEHYSERLIRLNRLPCYYQPVVAPTQIPTRSELGLPDTGTLYGCPQSLFKFHPDFDTVLTAIAEGDPTGHIVLLEGNNQAQKNLLRARWEKYAPVLMKRVLFLPRMPLDHFMGLMARIDVLLDPIHFGSGNTLFEGMAYGTPTVTWPGRFMRGRIVAGAYRQMGIENAPIAANVEEYAPLALALGRDPERRRDLRQASLQAAERELFADMLSVREFETFLEASVESAVRGEKLPTGWRPEIRCAIKAT